MSSTVPKIDPRLLRRVVNSIPATFQTGTLYGQGHIENVSKDGLFVRTPVVPPADEQIRVLFYDLDGKRIEVRGTVRWTTEQLPGGQKAKSGFGVHIELPSQDFVRFSS